MANTIIHGSTSNVADPNALVQGITPRVPVPTVGAFFSTQKQAQMEAASAEDQGLIPKQAGDHTLLASSAMPSWCNDIPSAGTQYIAACGGSADGNGQSSTGGNAPSWCENIPAASRADTPACANQDNAPLSAGPRCEGSSALLLAITGMLYRIIAYA